MSREFPQLDAETPWFVVLPDNPDAALPYAHLKAHAPKTVSHPSGRPWMVGWWPSDEVVVAQRGGNAVVVLGEHLISPAEVAQLAERCGAMADFDAVAARQPGSFHLLASVNGAVRVQGPLMRMRKVVHSRCHAGTIAANRADVLAWLTGQAVDPVRLSLRMLGHLPHPLDELPVFSNTHAVQFGHYLLVDAAGRSREVRWWHPPTPTRPLLEGAESLRQALVEAVRVRARTHTTISCDLGGVDSTALCALLADAGARVHAFTTPSGDPHDDDLLFAPDTASHLGVEHHINSDESMLQNYSDVAAAPPIFDEPTRVSLDTKRAQSLYTRAAACGSQVHIGGHGGDEILDGAAAWFRSYLFENPRLALHNLRGARANDRWPWAETLRQVIDVRSYGQWLRGFSNNLSKKPDPPHMPDLTWWGRSSFAPWVPRDVIEAARALIVATAATVQPLSSIRGMHQDLARAKSNSFLISDMAPLAQRVGVSFAAPFYDQQVIEAALSVLPQDRVTRWRYKPLLAAAMYEIVPESARKRNTKGEFSAAKYRGLRDNRAAMLDQFKNSQLAQIGLIDHRTLMAKVGSGSPTEDMFTTNLENALACEIWMQSHSMQPA